MEMNKTIPGFRLCCLVLLMAAGRLCSQTPVIYKAAAIYVGDTLMHKVEAMAVSGDRILQTGNFNELTVKYANATIVDMGNKFIYPGFIDAHCHFLAYAYGLEECNLVGTKSVKAVVKKLKKFAKGNKREWLIGRGWDQNDWTDKQYPDISILDKAFPNIPVCLKRIDGHAIWINSAAVRALKLNTEQQITGGEILKTNGKFNGILIDNAIDLVSPFIPELDEKTKTNTVNKAASLCYAAGLTTVDDAGLEIKDIEFIQKLQDQKKLDLRIYAMISFSEKNMAWISTHGSIKTTQLSVNSVKFYLDGALGSRGALMKQDYCDRPGYRGLLLTNTKDFYNYSYFLYSQGFQVCVHAIGDSANKIALKTFNSILPTGSDPRWRIEHAQITDPVDFNLYRTGKIIPSVQPTHATSDAPWAESRICANRIAGAYSYETLRRHARIVALGTDFPVEDISPIKTFYSAVTRLDASGNLKEPFIPRESLTREHALLGMTYWAAFANREDLEKGSLEAGKLADFVVTDTDLMTVPENKIPAVKVTATYIGGKMVYGKK
ncbi:MAG: amidohydrolase [Bacteroidetes bacterium]|nr:amidohydrolase [Bacteroidota bacterium]